jgi:hypothetical protein
MHWLMLAIGVWDILMSIVYAIPRRDPFYVQFMMPFYLFMGAFLIVTWATTFTTLRGGVLKNRKLFFWRKNIPVAEIASVEPHKRNGKWGYGAVFNVWTKSGEKLTLQPNRPVSFLAMLKQQAPEAIFHV